MIYSTVDQFRLHAPEITADDAVIKQRLLEASLIVDANFPDVERRVLNGTLNDALPELVVNRMVKRSLETMDAPSGVDSIQSTAGPFTESVHFSSNRDGNIFLSGQDKAMLRGARSTGRAFTIFPSGGAV